MPDKPYLAAATSGVQNGAVFAADGELVWAGGDWANSESDLHHCALR